MKVGVLDGDFTISIDESGNQNSKLVLSTSYNVIPLWLRVAYDNASSSHQANKAISEKWDDNSENQKSLLLAELIPSMQVFVACGTALDALYEQLRPFAKISAQDIETWKKNGTSRPAQIAQIINRVYRLNNAMSKAFNLNIDSIVKFRDQAVHPTHEIKRACTRPDVPVGVDWRFSAYRHHNASIAFQRTIEMFIHLYEKGSPDVAVKENMQNIFKSLTELGVVSVNA
jgi:hypothetical protein